MCESLECAIHMLNCQSERVCNAKLIQFKFAYLNYYTRKSC